MSQTLEQTAAEQILLRLLSGAIRSADVSLEEPVDWPAAMRMAQAQGVTAVVFEAVERMGQQQSARHLLPNRALLMQWYSQTLLISRQQTRHLSLAREIATLWAERGLRTIVFKGLAHSRYYPQPAHREFGDFDCFLLDSGGRPAYQRGNEVARALGLAVEDGWYKHSHIIYKGLTIENHQYFTAARRGGADKRLNEYLLAAIGDGSALQRLGDTPLYVLPVEAEGLFMLYHALTHFLVEGIRLRHIVDWACWIQANQGQIEWKVFYKQCQRFRLDGFVDVLNTIAAKHFGVQLHDPAICTDSPHALRVIASALHDDTAIYSRSRGRWWERLHVVDNALHSQWKFRDVAHRSMLAYVGQFVLGFIKRGEGN